MAIVGLLLWSLTPRAESTASIDWRVIDWPPFYILDKEDQGTGIYDGLINYMTERLSDYQHRQVEMTTMRARASINDGANLCHPSVIVDDIDSFKTPDGRRSVVVSKVNSILFPHAVAYDSRKFSPDFDQPLMVEHLLGNAEMLGGVTPGRYSKWLNQAIERNLTGANLLKEREYQGLMSMLLAGRIDYLFEYAPVVNYWKSKASAANHIETAQLEDADSPVHVLVAFACTNNAWGKRVIAEINKALDAEIHESHFWQSRLRWYGGRDRVRMRRIYEAIYFEDKVSR